MKVSTSTLVALAALLALNAMGAVYLGAFNQGAVSGGEVWRALPKVGALLFFALAGWGAKLRVHPAILALTLLHLLFFFSTVMLIAATGDFPRDTQWLNFHAALPVLWISYLWSRERVSVNLLAWPLAITLMVSLALDVAVFAEGASLWDNRAFIGTLGNPSTFGFVCVLGILYSRRFSGVSRLLIGAILLSAAVATQSLFAVLVATTVFAVLNWKASLVFVPLIALVIVQFVSYVQDMHVVYKLASMGQFFASGAGDSASVATRVQFYGHLADLLVRHPVAVLFGHPAGAPYISGDAGWFSLAVSYGVPLVLVYLVVIGTALRLGPRPPQGVLIARDSCLVFLLFMIVNRIHDYWPIALIFYWQLGQIVAWKERRIEPLSRVYSLREEGARA